MKKLPLFLLLIGLGACKPRKAIALKEAITQKERVAFNIIVGNDGAGEQKLHCLLKKDYPGALAALASLRYTERKGPGCFPEEIA
ncbi:hypothetical protein [Chitinophaga qingshengii]|uniref:Uncharacterized protein n=1 Tax=Chitinophaga qingshengii TaxID=1569794 RepID=A0ABR7TI43_9BACT|nr:hypothetical protein [Chitinophaga qingshengii]MBC9930182.1 hypothetical protein [Chitinophaga qingshengii]